MRQRWDVVNHHQARREERIKNPAVLSGKSCELAPLVVLQGALQPRPAKHQCTLSMGADAA